MANSCTGITEACQSHCEGDVRSVNPIAIETAERLSQHNVNLSSPTKGPSVLEPYGDANASKSKVDRSRLDWNRHKSSIKRLYIDENRPLKEVMRVMEKEYDFIATSVITYT